MGERPAQGNKEYLPIGTCAGQHLVDTEDMVGMYADAEMESVLAGGLGDVLVGANTGGLKGLARELLVLVGDKVAAVGELVDRRTLAAKIEDTDLRARKSSDGGI